MPHLDVALDYQLLARVLSDPATIDRLTPEAFGRAMDVAQRARLLGWLVEQVRAGHVPPDAPQWLRDRLVTADALVGGYERAVRWEIDRLSRAFLDTGQMWILLKGGAYIAAGLPPGRGRRVADIDVLVPRADLDRVEQILQEHGWQFPEIDAYDNRYYREWMHELPPMVHRDRHSIVDVHHAILPRTSRLKPSPERLLERATPVAGAVLVLCPSHMVLHAAAHLFHDGEIAGAIRDLVDLDQLLRSFGQDDAFWGDLLQEAVALDLTRPAYYALRYAHRWFDTPVPNDVTAAASAWAPPAAVRRLMDALVQRTIPEGFRDTSQAAVFALYVRSHWLRMPPVQVIRHLTRKSLSVRRE
jgi:Uncharacterised nucleotidyltransferase